MSSNNKGAEIFLRPNQFCNLTEVSATDVESQKDFNERVRVAAFLGTLQASYTDFHYLRDVWKKTTEKDALLGVGITGIASGKLDNLNLEEAANVAKKENARVADIIGINHAKRVTTVKPAGTSSLVLGCSSGIHAWHNDYYLRRIRLGKNESLYGYLNINHPEILEEDVFAPETQGIVTIPQKAPEGAVTRTESVFSLLERIKRFNLEWVKTGHRGGDNTNNVSATVSIKPDEWGGVGEWMWENRESFNGLSVLPYDNGSYTQAPFEDITKEQYDKISSALTMIDLTKVIEFDDNTELSGEVACGGGACEIT